MHEVAIVGGGPAGLAAAHRLALLGVKDVVVLEREALAGGIPRHCGHLGFGWRAFKRVWTGPRFAAALRERVRDLDVRTATSVLELKSGGVLRVHTARGISDISARRVLLATGVREASCAARLAGSARPAGVMNTGALQQFVYLQARKPFARPVIVGSEWVSFSAILTCHQRGIRPVALLEQGERIVAPRPGDVIARALLGVPVLTATKLISIEGATAVEAVMVERCGKRERIACDGVIFSGRFQPESALFMEGPVQRDAGSGGPSVDQFFRCTDPTYFAAGNVVHPVETAGWCWTDGVAAAQALVADGKGTLPPHDDCIAITYAEPLKYVYPQRIARSGGRVVLRARVTRAARGVLRVTSGGTQLLEMRLAALPERRIEIPVMPDRLRGVNAIRLELSE